MYVIMKEDNQPIKMKYTPVTPNVCFLDGFSSKVNTITKQLPEAD